MARVDMIHKGMDPDFLDTLQVSDHIAYLVTLSSYERKEHEAMARAVAHGISMAFGGK
jgi:hypothetical protein